jgi:hypothetical protein
VNFSGIETVKPSTTPALLALTTAVAVELDAGGPIPALCARLARVLGDVLCDDGLAPLFAGHERSFVLHQDPQRGFVVNASVHAPRHRTPAHDHAEAWAIYGMYRGRTAYRLFDRGDDLAPGLASLRLVEECVAKPPSVAIVLPGQVHENWNPDETTSWNVVLRPRPLAELWRRTFDCETGRYHPMRRAK